MRAVIQRVSGAEVRVDGALVGQIGRGLLILVCAMPHDDLRSAALLAAKILKLRIFPDEDGRTNCDLAQVGGAALVVSQFTLAADLRRGNRPGFSGAADPQTARALYEAFAQAVAAAGIPTATGRFGADMQVHLVNDGPFTLWLDSADLPGG